jgi:hypothetical protein
MELSAYAVPRGNSNETGREQSERDAGLPRDGAMP